MKRPMPVATAASGVAANAAPDKATFDIVANSP